MLNRHFEVVAPRGCTGFSLSTHVSAKILCKSRTAQVSMVLISETPECACAMLYNAGHALSKPYIPKHRQFSFKEGVRGRRRRPSKSRRPRRPRQPLQRTYNCDKQTPIDARYSRHLLLDALNLTHRLYLKLDNFKKIYEHVYDYTLGGRWVGEGGATT